ncbi:acid protease [Microthyrium microscopicum]|uniref:Acid protease n=1 Tax=Microthyrium microscopicum TaxID=703497 RepID=A0A6A6UEZ2_9PEZI|nr:acid protease [Microthyrium microscopicum]
MNLFRSSVVLSLLSATISEAQDIATPNGLIQFPISKVLGSSSTSESGLVKRQASTSLVNDFSIYGVYLINLTIGSNNQPISVQFDTGSFELWVNPSCSTGLNPSFCSSLPRYDPATSTTAKGLNSSHSIIYGSGNATLADYTDKVQLGTASVPSMKFGVATSSNGIDEGILGMSPVSASNSSSSFLQGLVAAGSINTATFSVDLAHSSVLFSGLDSNKYQCGLAVKPILSPSQAPDSQTRYWITLDGLTISQIGGNTSTALSLPAGGQPVVLDTGTTYTYLPQTLVDTIGTTWPNSVFNASENAYFAPCSQPGSLNFTFATTVVSVPFSSLLASGGSVAEQEANFCQIGIFAGPQNVYVLGDAFLNHAYVVFDNEHSQILIGQSANCGTNLVPFVRGQSSVPQISGCSCPTSNSSSIVIPGSTSSSSLTGSSTNSKTSSTNSSTVLSSATVAPTISTILTSGAQLTATTVTTSKASSSKISTRSSVSSGSKSSVVASPKNVATSSDAPSSKKPSSFSHSPLSNSQVKPSQASQRPLSTSKRPSSKVPGVSNTASVKPQRSSGHATASKSFQTSSKPSSSAIVKGPDPSGNDRCGPQNGNYKCSNDQCCSTYGYCGEDDDYCRVGCNPLYGRCEGSSLSVMIDPTGNGRCGTANNGFQCPSQCCSEYGYCGDSTSYCGRGCQSKFGTCW